MAADPAACERPRTVAHLSDLHFGSGRRALERATALSEMLLATRVDHLVVTGDITHWGQHGELDQFQRVFSPWLERGSLSLVPGNHDRLKDDLKHRIMPASRVVVDRRPGLHLVLVDSTGPHNRNWITGHGLITAEDITEISRALDGAAPGSVVALLLHHHLLPLPGEDLFERFFSWMGWPFAEALALGEALLDAVRGRCDLVLHGHRHVPGTTTLFADSGRPLAVCNAGSSTGIGGTRIFTHRAGCIVGSPVWMYVGGWLPADAVNDLEGAQPMALAQPARSGR